MSSVLDELFAYVSLDDEDVQRLRELHPILAPHFAAIADRFYDALLSHEGASAVLSGPAQTERLRITLIDWMSTGLLGPYDDRFYERRSRIGRRHVAIGLQQHYMFTAMNVVRTAYQDFITRLIPERSLETLRSVNKLLDIELAIMVRHYQLDSEDKLISRERRIQADKLLAMQTLSAGLAHEIRNPLNSAKLQLELLERRLRRQVDDPRLVEPSELAQKEIERLTALLDDFLAFARPPALNSELADVAAIVRNVVELERVTAERKGASLTLLRSPMHLTARVDAPKLHQIVLNLLRNASEAVARGGRIEVELLERDHEFAITIQDNGPGIPPGIRARIFEPFFSTKEGGTGLGMSIVHSLVDLHDGRIDLETGPDIGTRFEISIPRRM